MIFVEFSKEQIHDFAASCYDVIISEIKDACNTEETTATVAENAEHTNAA